MTIEIIFSIVGTFLAIGLSVNAFFLRGIYQDLNKINIDIAKLTSNSDARVIRINRLEAKIEEHERTIGDCRERIQALEGASTNIINYLKDSKND